MVPIRSTTFNGQCLRVRVSETNHDPDFDLVKESHQVAITLHIGSNDLNKESANLILNLFRIK
jgi:hypothetical protein